MSDTSASPSPSLAPYEAFTLRDYVLHQRVLQQLLLSQPVWLLDEVLGLRYRARLQLRLSPHPQLCFREDAAGGLYSEVDQQLKERHDASEHRGNDCQATEGEDGYPVVPLTPACSIELSAGVSETCDSGLRLCVAPAPDCGTTTSAESVSFLIIPASTAAGFTPASAWVTVLRRLCRFPRAPQRSSGAIDVTERARGNWNSLSVLSHVDPVSTDHRRADTSSAVKESDEDTLPLAAPTPSPRSSCASPPPPVQALPGSPAHLTAGADMGREVKEENSRQLEFLSAALRARTREAAELKAHLQRATATTSTVAAVVDSVTDTTPAKTTAEEEVERPSTMAHVSSGLVPALQRFPPHLAEVSSEDDEGCGNEDEGKAAGEQGAVQEVRSSFRDNANCASFSLSEDSGRPQAPRSGHVCNLGSLGPTYGDEDALRIYNEIHGGRSSTCSSANDSSTSSMSSATSVHMPPPGE
ncbi:hypothetical protein Q4I28_000878 [Leishmania naiffi]|uniref:Uncharacterized protein n=1 Tax=Leishmania naiffi TaxID=5678 RepID=A0AAW3C901_9TRYP